MAMGKVIKHIFNTDIYILKNLKTIPALVESLGSV